MGENIKVKSIVLSGINLIDGGALSVYYDFLESLMANKKRLKYRIILLVGNKKLFDKYKDEFEIIEFPKSKKNWLFRIYYEYIYFKFFSKKLDCEYWISLHDITPNVVAKKQYVYCHNPSPFNKMKIGEIKYGFKYYLFSKFYKYLYKINIKKNTGIIVQQEWIRDEFKKMYNVENVIVARPSIPNVDEIKKEDEEKKIVFVYPSYPRYYKNFEVLCKAANILKEEGYENFEVIITVDGSENKYSKDLVKLYSSNDKIKFCGLLKRENLFEVYAQSNCLVFMSKLETWGMPIIEYKQTQKNMIVSDLPYAYETVGNYKNVAFVDIQDEKKLAEKMKEVIEKGYVLGENKLIKYKKPFADNWEELIDIIFKEGENVDE